MIKFINIDSKLFRKGPIIGSTIHSKVYLSLDSETGNFIAIKALQSPFPEQTVFFFFFFFSNFKIKSSIIFFIETTFKISCSKNVKNSPT